MDNWITNQEIKIVEGDLTISRLFIANPINREDCLKFVVYALSIYAYLFFFEEQANLCIS